MNGAEQGGPHFIHEAHDDGGGREVIMNPLLGAPAMATWAHRQQPGVLPKISRLRVCQEEVQGGGNCQMLSTEANPRNGNFCGEGAQG